MQEVADWSRHKKSKKYSATVAMNPMSVPVDESPALGRRVCCCCYCFKMCTLSWITQSDHDSLDLKSCDRCVFTSLRCPLSAYSLFFSITCLERKKKKKRETFRNWPRKTKLHLLKGSRVAGRRQLCVGGSFEWLLGASCLVQHQADGGKLLIIYKATPFPLTKSFLKK